MSQEASDSLLTEFISITGVNDPAKARFYLDSSGSDLQLAVSTFYEAEGTTSGMSARQGQAEDAEESKDEDDVVMTGSFEQFSHSSQRLAPSGAIGGGGHTLGGGQSLGGGAQTSSSPSSGLTGGAYTLSGTPVSSSTSGTTALETGSSGWSGANSSGRSTPASSSNPFKSSAAPRVASLRDFSSSSSSSKRSGGGGGNGSRFGRIHHGDDENDAPSSGAGRGDDTDDPLEFFTGGGKSGLSVENPNANRAGADDVIKGIFKQAVEGAKKLAGSSGAVDASTSKSAGSVFTGSAHTLGSDETPSTFIPSSASRNAGDDGEDEASEEEEVAIRNLTFWQDGFSIEDGDLMRYDDPANEEILKSINAGRAPLSLLNVRHDQPVELRVARRMNEQWKRQPPPPKGPFEGQGHRLGSEVPTFNPASPATASSSASMGASAPARTTSGRVNASNAGGHTIFEIDDSEPVTNIQIRLRNGERLIGRFNHHHTIRDVRVFINNSTPGQNSQNYVLQTTFPSKDLIDENMTVKDAGLLGSVVVQRGL